MSIKQVTANVSYSLLVQSLSAAHLLTASCTSSSQDPSSEPAASFSDSERQAPPPPDHGDTLSRPTTSGVEPDVKGREKDDSFTTPEIAINAATVTNKQVKMVSLVSSPATRVPSIVLNSFYTGLFVHSS